MGSENILGEGAKKWISPVSKRQTCSGEQDGGIKWFWNEPSCSWWFAIIVDRSPFCIFCCMAARLAKRMFKFPCGCSWDAMLNFEFVLICLHFLVFWLANFFSEHFRAPKSWDCFNFFLRSSASWRMMKSVVLIYTAHASANFLSQKCARAWK